MASSMLLFLLAVLAVSAAASGYGDEQKQPPYTSSSGQPQQEPPSTRSPCDQPGLKYLDIIGQCISSSAKELIEKRNDCCYELAEHVECVCPTVKKLTAIAGDLPLEGLCGDYAACSEEWGSWRSEDPALPVPLPSDETCKMPSERMLEKCTPLKEALLQQGYRSCFFDLASLRDFSGLCFAQALFDLGISIKNMDGVTRVIKELCPRS